MSIAAFRYFLIIGLLVANIAGRAQFVMQDVSSEKFQKFLRSTTLVVLQDEDEEYNVELKKAMKAHWKITPYDFIYSREIATYAPNGNFSILLTMNLISQGYENYKSSYFAIVVCGPRYLSSEGFPITVAAKVLLDNPGTCNSCYNNTDNVDFNVRMLCHGIDLAIEKQAILKEPETIRLAYGAERRLLETRPLLVHSAMFRPANVKNKKWLSEEEFRSIYPWPFRAVSDKEINKIIKSGDTSSVFFYRLFDPVDAERYYYFFVSALDGHIVYLPRADKNPVLNRKFAEEMVAEMKR